MLIDKDWRPELFDLRRSASLGLMPGLGPSTNNFVVGFGTNWVCHLNDPNHIQVDEWNGSQFTRLGTVALVSPAILVFKAAFSPARQLVAWNDPPSPKSIFVANVATPGRRIELTSQIDGLFPFLFNDDGKYLVALSPEGRALCVWNVDTGHSVVTYRDWVMNVAFAVGGRVLVACLGATSGHEIRFYDLDHPDRAPRCIQGKQQASTLAVSPDGQLVAVLTGGHHRAPVRCRQAIGCWHRAGIIDALRHRFRSLGRIVER
jgi:WD40 repeat protein